ncbi:hypothetical protein CCACVL1_06753 [Corchorus capsularis]|uniref:Uncharacterized protein n=1 Tax=Corchorus capsularis TaxID=210143 RepID=A0A1R3JD90_COCAP|nr:hypothetical protein CCACVL1_06753 [Corchorus capsularis]
MRNKKAFAAGPVCPPVVLRNEAGWPDNLTNTALRSSMKDEMQTGQLEIERAVEAALVADGFLPDSILERFENKVGSSDVVAGEKLIKKRILERFFIDVVAGKSLIKERAAVRFNARLNDKVGSLDVVAETLARMRDCGAPIAPARHSKMHVELSKKEYCD